VAEFPVDSMLSRYLGTDIIFSGRRQISLAHVLYITTHLICVTPTPAGIKDDLLAKVASALSSLGYSKLSERAVQAPFISPVCGKSVHMHSSLILYTAPSPTWPVTHDRYLMDKKTRSLIPPYNGSGTWAYPTSPSIVHYTTPLTPGYLIQAPASNVQ